MFRFHSHDPPSPVEGTTGVTFQTFRHVWRDSSSFRLENSAIFTRSGFGHSSAVGLGAGVGLVAGEGDATGLGIGFGTHSYVTGNVSNTNLRVPSGQGLAEGSGDGDALGGVVGEGDETGDALGLGTGLGDGFGRHDPSKMQGGIWNPHPITTNASTIGRLRFIDSPQCPGPTWSR